jgi:hypothetical protein
MSLVDVVFGSLPKPLIDQWGIDIVYLKASEHQNYDPVSGTVLGIVSEIPARALIVELTPKEREGFYQQRVVKFMLPAVYLGSYYPQSTDSIRYAEAGVFRTAKIVDQEQYRGDSPIMHALIARVS